MPMRIVIVGGGLVGLALARLLGGHGLPGTVVERRPPGVAVRRGFMLGRQGYDAAREMGVMGVLETEGRAIGTQPDGSSAATAIDMGRLLTLLEDGSDVRFSHGVTGLVRDAGGRVCGVAVEGPAGAATIPADLVVACDGIRSRVREMAGITPETTPLEEGKIEWISPAPTVASFAMSYLADGGHIGLLSWRDGSFGWRTTRRVGREAALAPGLEALVESWCRLLPDAAAGVSALASMDEVVYTEPYLLRCARWWTPGVVVIGDAAHFFGPETGASAGIGLADAQALAHAVARTPDDPDTACRTYEAWRAPGVRAYEQMDPSRHRTRGVALPPGRPEEAWPPPAG